MIETLVDSLIILMLGIFLAPVLIIVLAASFFHDRDRGGF